MKKFITVFLALTFLLSTVSVLSVTASAAEGDPLTVKLYDVQEDSCALYLVFSEPVEEPSSDFALSLCGHGWPINDANGNTVLRWLVRSTIDKVECLTDTVWRVTYGAAFSDAQRAEYKSWILSTCASVETVPASVDEWAIRIWGTFITKDGKKVLDLDIDTEVYNDNASALVDASYYLCAPTAVEKAADIYALGIPLPETDPPATEPVTEAPAETKAPETKATETKATETNAPETANGTDAKETEAKPEKKGCKSVVSSLLIVPMLLAAAYVCGKKH